MSDAGWILFSEWLAQSPELHTGKRRGVLSVALHALLNLIDRLCTFLSEAFVYTKVHILQRIQG